MLPVLLAAALAGGVPSADTLPRPPQVAAPAVIVHRQPGLPLVALRLSLLAADPPGYAGVGHLLQHLHYPTLQRQAERVGGQAQIERNADALVFTVVGPSAELAHLAGALAGVLALPRPSEVELLAASRALAEERLAEWETAAGHARSRLRARLFPQDLPAAGTAASAERWSAEALPGLWAVMYRPERVSVVAVGDVTAAAVAAAFRQLPAPPAVAPPALEPDTVRGGPAAAPQATRAWLARGYPVATASPAAVAVAARLLGERLRRALPGASVQAEHWWTHHGQAVALLVAAPEPQAAAARRALGGAAAGLRESLTAAAAAEAAAGVRRELLFYARTPANMAQLIGQFADRGGEPDAAQRFFDALGDVPTGEVEALLDDWATQPPLVVEISPQPLPRRP